MDTILVVSPHLDDAVLSIGASIAAWVRADAAVHVVTVFSGIPELPLSPVAQRFHLECGLADSDAISQRRTEDITALATLGAQPHHLSFLDAIYRTCADGVWLCQSDRAMFSATDCHEPALVAQIVFRLVTLSKWLSPSRFATCMGLGGHLDHRITRTATDTAAALVNTPITFWEDLPYAVGEPVPFFSVYGPAPRNAPEWAWTLKYEAVGKYDSQVRMLWGSGFDWQSQLVRHAKERGKGTQAELTWE